MTEPVGFCTRCSFKIESWEGLTECPQCGSKSIPCGFEDQVDISINTHELRILCIWSENWGKQIEKDSGESDANTVYAIAGRIRKQLGEKDCPLTMADEFNSMREAGINFETNHPADDQP